MSANDLPINFSYAKWTPNTRFKLCNVPWDMGYRDIVKWDRQAQQEYFNRLDGIEFTNCTMSKYGLPVRLPVPFAQACQYNYLIATNDYDFDTPRSWYYFIQTCDYVNANTTQLNIQLDVWQSFQHDIRLGNAYVERGHVGVANENAWKDWGKTYLDLPEGLDTGKCTVFTNESWKPLMDIGEHDGVKYTSYGLIIVSTTDLEANTGTKDNPVVNTATGSAFESQLNGTSMYYLDTPADIVTFFTEGMNAPWVTQGICGIYAVPHLPQALLDGQPKKRNSSDTR